MISQNLQADPVSKTISFAGGAAETNSLKPLPFYPAQEHLAWLRVDLLRRSRLVVLLYHVDVKFSTLLLRPIGPITVVALVLDEPLALRHGDGASRDVGWPRGTTVGSAGGNVWSRHRGGGESHGAGGQGREMDLILYNCAASLCLSRSSGRRAV